MDRGADTVAMVDRSVTYRVGGRLLERVEGEAGTPKE